MRVRRRGQGIGEVGTTTIHCARILPVVPSVACSSRVVGGPLIQIPTVLLYLNACGRGNNNAHTRIPPNHLVQGCLIGRLCS